MQPLDGLRRRPTGLLHTQRADSCLFCTDFQTDPLPKTNPILIGHRWKEYHEALGLQSIVDYSWEMVQKEKEDMLHVLDFPYNGETLSKYIIGDGKITHNKHHL